MNDFEYVRLDSNLKTIRAVTPPYIYYSHFTDGKMKICKMLTTNGCVPCSQGKPKPRWLVGVMDKSTGKYSILNMPASLYKKVQDIVREHGDPQSYDIEVGRKDIKLVSTSLADSYEVKYLEQYPIIVDASEKQKLTDKLVKLTEPMCQELDEISSVEEFKNYYISVHTNPSMVDRLCNLVPKWYAQYKEILHKLVTFS